MVTRKRRVRVQFIDHNTTVEGIQVARTRSDLLLDAAELVLPNDKRESLAGRTAIPRPQILFRQILR